MSSLALAPYRSEAPARVAVRTERAVPAVRPPVADPPPDRLPLLVPPPRLGWRPQDAAAAYALALDPWLPGEPSIDVYA